MQKEYKVKAYAPTVKGCGTPDVGWDEGRCEDFQKFINSNATDGWCLHSYEYRSVTAKGCGGGRGSWLVCVFEKEK
jgi:hypothetical protein